jgi:hypothetical protein
MLAASATTLADEIDIHSAIVYGDASNARFMEKNPPHLKELQIDVNDQGWVSLPLTFDYAHVSLKEGDRYAIKIKAVDDQWYHTKSNIYHSDRTQRNPSFNVGGVVTPLNLVMNGVEVSRFYNEKGYRGVAGGCEMGGPGLNCNFSGPNATSGFAGGGPAAGTGAVGGTFYLDDQVKPGLSDGAEVEGMLFYTRIKFGHGSGSLGGFLLGGGYYFGAYY